MCRNDEGTYLASDSGRIDFACSPSRFVRSFTSPRCILCASATQYERNVGCLFDSRSWRQRSIFYDSRPEQTDSFACCLIWLLIGFAIVCISRTQSHPKARFSNELTRMSKVAILAEAILWAKCLGAIYCSEAQSADSASINFWY